ncbi:MAG: rhodanese-like domain-containing protein [Pseudomonadota bacterium]
MTFLLESYNPLLVALMAMSGTVLVWPSIERFFSGGREVGTLEATRLINNNALVLDVRDAAEFAGGHIPRARHIPLTELEKRVSELVKFKGKPVIVNGKNGLGVGQAIRVLTKNQFTDIYKLKGGIAAWQEANLPVERKDG